MAIAIVGMGAAPGLEPAARAQTSSEIALAKQWFSDGLAREEKGEFPAALDLFRRAAQIKKTPQILYHVGFCESRTGALVEALVDLDGAQAQARRAGVQDVVRAATAELELVKRRLPTLDVRVQGGAVPSRLLVDGTPVALTMLGAEMPLDPGDHTVTVELASGALVTRKATLAEGDRKRLDLEAPVAPLPAAAPAPAPPPAPAATPALASASAPPTAPTPGPAPAPASQASSLPWILTGVGGALVAGGVALVLVAHGKESTLDEACPTHTACDPSLSGTYDTARSLDAIGLAGGAVGLVAAGTGLTLLLTHPGDGGTTSATVGLGTVGLRGRF
jgi:hypothetical protein